MPAEKSLLQHYPKARPADIAAIAAALLLSAAFSLWMRTAPADEPRFLLAPVAWLSGALSGVRFGFLPGTGYCGTARSGTLFIVEKSCSGGNFLAILFPLLAITSLPRVCKLLHRLALLAGLLLFSILSAVAASSLRIAASVPLIELGTGFEPVLIHNVVGIATYLAAICLCYLAVQRLFTYRYDKAARL